MRGEAYKIQAAFLPSRAAREHGRSDRRAAAMEINAVVVLLGFCGYCGSSDGSASIGERRGHDHYLWSDLAWAAQQGGDVSNAASVARWSLWWTRTRKTTLTSGPGVSAEGERG